MSRSIKKGPYVEGALMKRIKEMNDSGKKSGRQDLEPLQHDLP